MDWLNTFMAWLKGWFAKTFNSMDPSIDFSHVILAIAFLFATGWLTATLHASKWQMTAIWATAFATYMGAIFAKGIWGKDGK